MGTTINTSPEKIFIKSNSRPFKRRWPIGAEVVPEGGVHFRLWAPKCPELGLQLFSPSKQPVQSVVLEPEGDGYYSLLVPDAKEGMLYKFLVGDQLYPDPASRFQPDGPHGFSQVVNSASFQWKDESWKGIPRDQQIVYEMHIGTFTVEGTWSAAMAQLPELARLGITTLEIMPVADFSGRFGWGYDGVCLFAPTRLYGSADDFRDFVNEAHQLGLAVILDVVYNHLGPDGNYLGIYSDHYVTQKYKNEWGEALNFDGAGCASVREFFVTNAAYWIEEFHLDGLRLDATQSIHDGSAKHIITEIGEAVRKVSPGRHTFMVAENEPQESHLVRPIEEGGCGLDALWNDDLHHVLLVAATGRHEAYYSDYRGTPQEMISALKYGYLFQGQYYYWQKKPRGTPSLDLTPAHFVSYIQNHDQVANSLKGLRLHQLTSPGKYRALTAFLLISPEIPMLFQGQEFSASSPFFYFADHHAELNAMVCKGRREFLQQFHSMEDPSTTAEIPDPGSEKEFRKCLLNFQERESNATSYRLHKDLIALRKTDPVFSKPAQARIDGAVIGSEAFVIRFFSPGFGDRIMVVNLGPDLALEPISEPLMAPPSRSGWKMVFSSGDPKYGGGGTAELDAENRWLLPAESTLVFIPETKKRNSDE